MGDSWEGHRVRPRVVMERGSGLPGLGNCSDWLRSVGQRHGEETGRSWSRPRSWHPANSIDLSERLGIRATGASSERKGHRGWGIESRPRQVPGRLFPGAQPGLPVCACRHGTVPIRTLATLNANRKISQRPGPTVTSLVGHMDKCGGERGSRWTHGHFLPFQCCWSDESS